MRILANLVLITLGLSGTVLCWVHHQPAFIVLPWLLALSGVGGLSDRARSLP